MIKRLKPYLGVGLALWLGCGAMVAAQDNFYIELRGPESSDSKQLVPPAQNTSNDSPLTAPTATQTPQPSTTSAAPPPVMSPGRYGPIRSTDTLWAIAARNTTAPTTVQQTMVALYHLNSQAFVRGNINHLQRGAQLRLPTQTQATQRSASEAEREFRQLSRQGSRNVTRAAQTNAPTTPAPQATAPKPEVKSTETSTQQAEPSTTKGATPPKAPQKVAEPVVPSAPVAAAPPSTDNATGLSEPKAATPVESKTADSPISPAQSEETALNRLQLQLMDELREQVSMSNEQLAALADNNQALRQRLTQLTAEVEQLKNGRSTSEQGAEPFSADEKPVEEEGWLKDLLNNPINLALILMLPALLLLALFTLWWRNRERRDLAEQEQELSESSAILEEENNDFEDLFSSETDEELDPMLGEIPNELELAPEDDPEEDVDEDAFARFLEEQQLQEEQENQQASEEGEQQAPDSDPLFEDVEEGAQAASSDSQIEDADEVLIDDTTSSDADNEQPMSNDDLDDIFASAESASAIDSPEAPTDTENVADIDLESVAEKADSVTEEPLSSDTETAVEDERDNDTAETLADSLFADGAPAAALDDSESFAPPVTETAAVDELLADESSAKDDYVSVEQLMDEAEAADGVTAERERKLDLELDDYADVIGQGEGVDIDADEGGIGAQLDLARAYIEIDDIDSARDLLNEALEQGNEAQQRDASKLLQRLDKRG
ncbi:MAG: FimV/HubP family polar landmark protein [Oceanisphaera sp.]